MTMSTARENLTRKALRQVGHELILDVLRFPLWWYTTGLLQAGHFVLQELASFAQRLSIRILLRNLFKPMYGDYTRSGRAISLFMRLIVFFFRFALLLVWIVILGAIFIGWILILPAAIVQLVLHIFD